MCGREGKGERVAYGFDFCVCSQNCEALFLNHDDQAQFLTALLEAGREREGGEEGKGLFQCVYCSG